METDIALEFPLIQLVAVLCTTVAVGAARWYFRKVTAEQQHGVEADVAFDFGAAFDFGRMEPPEADAEAHEPDVEAEAHEPDVEAEAHRCMVRTGRGLRLLAMTPGRLVGKRRRHGGLAPRGEQRRAPREHTE